MRVAPSVRLGRPILAGLGVMPGTPLGDLRPLIDLAPDLVLVLALDPRGDTSPDLVAAGERLRLIRQMAAPLRPLMAIDGGVTAGTIGLAAAASPDIIVSGSAIFRAPGLAATFRHLTAAWSTRLRPGTGARQVYRPTRRRWSPSATSGRYSRA